MKTIGNISNTQKFLRWWNAKFPLDRWYRQRNAIALGSNEHLDTPIIAMRMEWEEYRMFLELHNKEEVVEAMGTYDPNSDSPLKPRIKDFSNEVLEDFDLGDIIENADGSITFK